MVVLEDGASERNGDFNAILANKNYSFFSRRIFFPIHSLERGLLNLFSPFLFFRFRFFYMEVDIRVNAIEIPNQRRTFLLGPVEYIPFHLLIFHLLSLLPCFIYTLCILHKTVRLVLE